MEFALSFLTVALGCGAIRKLHLTSEGFSIELAGDNRSVRYSASSVKARGPEYQAQADRQSLRTRRGADRRNRLPAFPTRRLPARAPPGPTGKAVEAGGRKAVRVPVRCPWGYACPAAGCIRVARVAA